MRRHQHWPPAKPSGLHVQDQGKVQKAYIARVLGRFLSEAVTVDKHLAWDSRSNHAFVMDSDGALAERQSLGAVPLPSQRQQLQAKEAQTSFRLLSVAADGKTSLVECLPKTGRTHQIRWCFGPVLTCLSAVLCLWCLICCLGQLKRHAPALICAVPVMPMLLRLSLCSWVIQRNCGVVDGCELCQYLTKRRVCGVQGAFVLVRIPHCQ